MMKQKKLMGICASVILLAGCSLGSGGSAKSETQGLQNISLVLDWTPNTNHTGIYVAKEKGFFESEGLSVAIVQPPEGGSSAIVASKAEFGIDAQDTLAPALFGENTLPITAVAAIIQHNTSGIISLQEKGIDTPVGLEKKTYATWDNPVEKAMIESIVSEDGGEVSKVNMIPSTVTDVITALQTDVDAVWVYYAWDGIATEVKGLKTNFLDFGKLNPVFDNYTPVIVANNKFLKENPETAKAFLRACAKGYEYCIENPEEAAEILLAAAPELDRDIVIESQKWLADRYKAEVTRWGYIEPERWDGFYKWLSDNKLVEGEYRDGIGYSNEYLP